MQHGLRNPTVEGLKGDEYVKVFKEFQVSKRKKSPRAKFVDMVAEAGKFDLDLDKDGDKKESRKSPKEKRRWQKNVAKSNVR